MKTIAQKTAEHLLDIKAIMLRPNKPFRYTSGILSPVYIDNRIIISYPKIRQKIISYYIKTIKEKIGIANAQLVSGTAMAAIPHAAFISQKLNLPMVFVRDTKKGHGRQNKIEGIVEKNQKTIIIEDHISTGGSTIGNIKAIRASGGKVKYAIATTTFLMKKAENNFKKAKIKVFTLTDINEIIKIAIQRKTIKKEDKAVIVQWSKNPPAWGKKFGFEK